MFFLLVLSLSLSLSLLFISFRIYRMVTEGIVRYAHKIQQYQQNSNGKRQHEKKSVALIARRTVYHSLSITFFHI